MLSENSDAAPQTPEITVEPGETFELVAERFRDVRHKADAIDDLIAAKLEPFGEALEKIHEEINREDDPEEPLLDRIKNLLSAHITLEVFDKISPLVDQSFELGAEQEQLERKRELLARREVAVEQRALLEETNWDKLISAAADTYNFRDLRPLLESFNSTEDRPEHSLWIMREWRAFLKKEQMILAPDQRDNDEGLWHANGNLSGAITEWNQLTEQALHYMSTARRNELSTFLNSRTEPQLSRMARFADNLGLNGRGETHAPGIIADAIERQVAQRIEAFDDHDIAVRAKEIQELPNALFIENQKLFEETTGVADSPQWVHRAMMQFPAWYTQGVGSVSFTREYHDELLAAPQKGRVTLGEHMYEENKIHLDPYANLDNNPGFSPEDQRLLTLSNLRFTFLHELSHHAHAHILSVTQLRQWLAVEQMEPVAVSEYVQHKQEEATPGFEHTAGREDLCDSATEYQLHPGRLLMKAPLRFAYWNEVLGQYNDRAIDVSRMVIEHVRENGTAEDNLQLGYSLDRALIRQRYEAEEKQRNLRYS